MLRCFTALISRSFQATNLIESAKMILKSKVEALEEEAVEMKESNRASNKEATTEVKFKGEDGLPFKEGIEQGVI